MKAVLDPNLLFINNNLWMDDRCRDIFLDQILSILSALSDLPKASVLWSSELEELIWTPGPPWRADQDWNNLIVPQIYKKLHSLIEPSTNLDFCPHDMTSAFHWESVEGNTLTAFYFALHELLYNHSEGVVCASWFTPRHLGNRCWFKCGCSPAEKHLPAAYTRLDLLKLVDFFKDGWPKGFTSADASEFRKTLVLFAESRELAIIGGAHAFGFSEKFLRSILNELRDRRHILEAIARRLSVTQGEAGRDTGLHDEDLDGGVQRFRVSGAARIHYVFDPQGRIIFDEYFGEGKHDEGL